jgi:hypothetical protein
MLLWLADKSDFHGALSKVVNGLRWVAADPE